MDVVEFGVGFLIFFLGLLGFERNIASLTGPKLKNYLARLTSSFPAVFCCGLVLTAIVQSSSLVLVTLVGIARTGTIKLKQSLGIILGANLGTTITIHIFTWSLEEYYYLFFILAVAGYLLFQKKEVRGLCKMLFSLGLLFAGFYLLKANSGFLEKLLTGRYYNLITEPWGGLVSGIIITTLVQSSSVVSGLIIMLVFRGLLSLKEALPLIMGANIGTCSTAIFASFIGGTEGQKIAVAHLVFNLFGVVFWFPFRLILAHFIAMLSTVITRQVALFHTLFNLLTVFVFLPFLPLLVNILNRIFQEKSGGNK